MNLPILLAETATEEGGINWHSFFFLLFALVSCGMAVAVLFSRNIVRMAFYLTISLGAVSGLFILAGAHFVGAMQLMIYVGGTLVLLIFGVMLTAQAQFIEMKTRGGEWAAAAVVGGSLLALLMYSAFKIDAWQSPDVEAIAAREDIRVEPYTTSLGAALMGLRHDSLAEDDPQKKAGMSGYFIHFEIVSVHLLVVLIGAAFLARARHSVGDTIPASTAPPRTDRRRGIVVTIVLFVITLLVLAKAVVGFYVYATGDTSWFGELPLARAESWLWLVAGVLQLVIAFALISIMRWQRWGFYAICIVAVVLSVLTYAAGVGPLLSLGGLFTGVVFVGILFGLLSVGGSRSVWSQME